jgi:uncharacterized DUF497 family protein
VVACGLWCSYISVATHRRSRVPEWVWDPDKDAKNQQRHKLPLAAGMPVLNGDRLAVSQPDPHPDGDRWQTIGSAGGIVILFVVHTDPIAQDDGREAGRIISVRKATPHERRAYEESKFYGSEADT